VKTPIGNFIKPIERLHSRLGKIDKFEDEIKAMNINLDNYDYLIIDDYHGTEVPYYFKRDKNILVLVPARFSQFNIWRNDDLGIDLYSPVKSIPNLGKCIYIGKKWYAPDILKKLFGNENILGHKTKKVAGKNLEYYFIEYKN
jgi:hypothetical protein